jgi:3'(2'), 5'-bisphosphate nucleotidase
VISDADVSADAELAERLTPAIVKAAAAIRMFDCTRVETRLKSDRSPVTAADEAANAAILAELARIAPHISVVSEESEPSSADVRTSFFLVDPLDGTSEFLAGRNEYTVNIALVRDSVPVVGLVAAPALGIVWRGVVGRGAERLQFAANAPQPRDVARIRTRVWPADERVAAVSRSHYEAASAEFLARFAPVRTLSCGSALKFARVAEGAADIYPRLAPTSEWDVAAGHALILAAGGAVTTPQGAPLTYGRGENFLIPGFVAWGDPRAVIAA